MSRSLLPAFVQAAQPIVQHKARVNAASFSANGLFMATGDANGELIVWDAKSNLKFIASFDFSPAVPIHALAWLQDALLIGLRSGQVWSIDAIFSHDPRSEVVREVLHPVNALAAASDKPLVAAGYLHKALVARRQANPSAAWLLHNEVESEDTGDTTLDCQFIKENVAVLWHFDGLRLYSVNEPDVHLECIWRQRSGNQHSSMTVHGGLLVLNTTFEGLFCVRLPEARDEHKQRALRIAKPDALAGDGPTYVLPATFVASGLVIAAMSTHSRQIPIFSALSPNEREESSLNLSDSGSSTANSTRITTISSRMASGKTALGPMLVVGDAVGHLHVWRTENTARSASSWRWKFSTVGGLALALIGALVFGGAGVGGPHTAPTPTATATSAPPLIATASLSPAPNPSDPTLFEIIAQAQELLAYARANDIDIAAMLPVPMLLPTPDPASRPGSQARDHDGGNAFPPSENSKAALPNEQPEHRDRVRDTHGSSASNLESDNVERERSRQHDVQ
uniref:WD40 repeat-like protein n=1 Tax=Mycena chlorophos TaxID=658473 RepID=A0ABQ0KWT6_MYCCL|nr:predicted protein [Mycena chlorophos]